MNPSSVQLNMGSSLLSRASVLRFKVQSMVIFFLRSVLRFKVHLRLGVFHDEPDFTRAELGIDAISVAVVDH